MNKTVLKIIILVGVLLVPALLYTILVSTGKNQYKIGVLNPKSEVCPPPITGDTMHHIPPFQLVSQDGKTITNKDFEGKVYIAEFFFTRCPSICPIMASELTRVQEHFGTRKDVAILSHSIDPLYDSVQVLKKYGDRYNANYDFWTFATGDSAQLYTIAQCGYFIAAQKSPDSQLLFDHSDKLVLVDKERRIRGFYSGTKKEEVDRLILELQILLKEYE